VTWLVAHTVNLLQFYQRAMLKLSSGPGIKRPFQINAEGYRIADTPVTEALQEALVNALIHADYYGQGGIVIDRWVDRLEFSNPGTLLVSREQLQRGAVSECRNKSLQLMFQMLGAGDKAGSGIDKIRAGWASERWQSPSLQETLRPDRVRLVLPMVSMLPEGTLADLRQRFGQTFDDLDQDAAHILVVAALEGEVSNQRMQELLSMHRTDITALLRGLVEQSMLRAEMKVSKAQAAEQGLDLEEATRWIEGLDRIHKMRRIQHCFDLSATPFAPTGKASTETGLYEWIVSDFGLNDAIEAGLVKTPRVVIRDSALANAQTYRSKLYHMYREPEVADDLNRRGAEPHESLPQLVQQAYTLLGADWREAAKDWLAAGHTSPPVMLTVCNRTETSARIEYYFRNGNAFWPELHAPNRTLRVDSRVLEKAEVGETAGTDKNYEAALQAIVEAANIPATRKAELLNLKKEELLREIVDNVGKRGAAGQDLQNVLSVAMLSEGWDAKNVTHIMGLRAFTSQLLCEQVIGRGLRRVAYDREPVMCPDGVERELYKPEYVNVFGVPLSIFQDVGDGGEPPPPPKPSTQIESLKERGHLEIRWPNVLRVDCVVRPELVLDWVKVGKITLDPAQAHISADMAPALGGATNLAQVVSIDLEKLEQEFRLQRLIFMAAQKAFASMEKRFQGERGYLIFQLILLVEQYLSKDHLDIPSLFHQDPVRRRILIALNMDPIIQHLLQYIDEQNTERMEPVFDEEYPIGTTAAMRTWYTTKPCESTTKSQISHVVVDSTWEQYTANVLETSNLVAAYAKNDHLGFQVYYLWNGSKRRFVPDFIIRLLNGKTLVLEIKGEDSDQNKAKRAALDVWVKGVNAKGGFGVWCWDVAFEPAKVHDIIAAHAL
jgi:type III restriction enzyme